MKGKNCNQMAEDATLSLHGTDVSLTKQILHFIKIIPTAELVVMTKMRYYFIMFMTEECQLKEISRLTGLTVLKLLVKI